MAVAAIGPAAAGEGLGGKTITIVVGYGAGGGYDAYARLAADHLGKHIPGGPTVLVENMEGGGGRRSEVYLISAAPKDGTTISLVPDTIALDSVQGLIPGAFDANTLGYIGRLVSVGNFELTWTASATKSFADAQKRETVVGADGVGGSSSTVPRILNAILGTKFKIVEGYKGSADIALAMQRGEVEGMLMPLQTVKASHPDWIEQKSVNFLWLQAPKRHPDYPDVPALPELAATDDQRAILELISNNTALGRSFATPPGVSAEILDVYRKAFDEMVKDPDFLADAKKRKLAIDPLDGAAVQEIVKGTMATPPASVEKLQAILKGS